MIAYSSFATRRIIVSGDTYLVFLTGDPGAMNWSVLPWRLSDDTFWPDRLLRYTSFRWTSSCNCCWTGWCWFPLGTDITHHPWTSLISGFRNRFHIRYHCSWRGRRKTVSDCWNAVPFHELWHIVRGRPSYCRQEQGPEIEGLSRKKVACGCSAITVSFLTEDNDYHWNTCLRMTIGMPWELHSIS